MPTEPPGEAGGEDSPLWPTKATSQRRTRLQGHPGTSARTAGMRGRFLWDTRKGAVQPSCIELPYA